MQEAPSFPNAPSSLETAADVREHIVVGSSTVLGRTNTMAPVLSRSANCGTQSPTQRWFP